MSRDQRLGCPNKFYAKRVPSCNTFPLKKILFQLESKICIYDKFGKLVGQMDGTSEGWRGLLNGKPLPSSDYWYSVQLEDGRVYTGHFSLIRR